MSNLRIATVFKGIKTVIYVQGNTTVSAETTEKMDKKWLDVLTIFQQN